MVRINKKIIQKMKNILVPTDFSKYANNALSLATNIAKKSGGQIHLLNVVEPFRAYAGAVDGMFIDTGVEQKYLDYLKENAQTQIDNLLKEADFKDVNIQHSIELGAIFQVIKDKVKSQNIDLIVMGTQGVSGLDEILVGSNTEKVVRTSTCPVLTVREKLPDFDFKSIVFATNFKESQHVAIKELKRYQDLLDAEIKLLYVNIPNDFYTTREILKKKEEFVKATSLENYTFDIYNEVNEENGMIYYAEDNNADMITVVTHQRTGLAHLIAGSIAEDVVNHSKRPVLTFGLKYLKK